MGHLFWRELVSWYLHMQCCKTLPTYWGPLMLPILALSDTQGYGRTQPILRMLKNSYLAVWRGIWQIFVSRAVYALNVMKLVLAPLLLRYNLKLPDSCGRPRNSTIDSDMFPDPRA